MAINTKISVKIDVRFRLPAKADRDALETKIDTFISNQAEGSKAINTIYNDINFRTRLFVIANTIQDVANIRTNIMSALLEMPAVHYFKFNMVEELAPIVEE